MVKIVDEQDEDMSESMAEEMNMDSNSDTSDINEMEDEEEEGTKMTSITTKQGEQLWKRPEAPKRESVPTAIQNKVQPPQARPQMQMQSRPIKQKVPDVEVEEDVPYNPWSIREVPVQMQQVFYNAETEETLDINMVLIKILNMLENSQRALSG